MKNHFTTIIFICLFALSAFMSPLIMTGCDGDDDGGISINNGLDGDGDGNEAPTDISLSNDTVDENTDTSGGYSVGTLTTSDEDSGESFSYSVVGGADAGVFTIGGADSDELILTDGILDFETQSIYEVIVEVTDSGANTYQETLTVTVNDLDQIIELDFDDGTLQGWTADGLWHITTNRYSSSPNSIWYADEGAGNYDTGYANAGGVASPFICLGASPSLDFEYFLANECENPGFVCQDGDSFYDVLTVEIFDGSWTVLEMLPEADDFTPVTIDLSAYAYNPVMLRFYFDTVDSIGNDYEGAYVDNVVITTDGEICPTVALDAVDRGWWDNLGDHTSSLNNTYTGYSDGSGNTSNSYFIFDLSSVAGDITAAKLRLELEAYYGPDPSETVSVYDVSTDATTLEADGTGQTAIYDDLETGTVYGTFEVEAADVGTIIEIPLSAGAIDDINAAAGGSFSVGVHLDSLSVSPSEHEGVRFSELDEERTHQLILISY